MVIDSSAIVALLLNEPEADALEAALASDGRRLMAAFNVLESAVALQVHKGPAMGRELDLLLHSSQIEVVPMDSAQVDLARAAWRKFGKGNHAARLNLGDCCAYALSKSTGEPLLFKGADFAKTDVAAAPW